ncbi:cytochrome C [Acidobacteria bacterium AB60]|nr:cytochrome C [Acidobacteria bacterium AB60]
MNRGILLFAGALLAVSVAACSKLAGDGSERAGANRSAPELMEQYGCPACHVIPQVPGAVGKAGPSLKALDQRSLVAGILPNTPENLKQWIMHPQHFQPGTAMPEMGVTEQDATRIARFLESR